MLINPYHTSFSTPYLWGHNLQSGEHQIINDAVKNILNYGNGESKRIINSIINSQVAIDVHPVAQIGTSAISGINYISGLTNAIKVAGKLSETQALDFMFMTIAREQMSNLESVEANIIHEGKHLQTLAAVVVTLSTGNPKLYQDESMYFDELRASISSTAYLRARGGSHLAYGQHPQLQFIDQNGKINMVQMQGKASGASASFAQSGIKTIQQYLKAKGVSW
jgi:hypothetical protein